MTIKIWWNKKMIQNFFELKICWLVFCIRFRCLIRCEGDESGFLFLATIKQLKTQMGQISALLNPKKKMRSPSNTNAISKGYTTHYMVITTHNGKVVYNEAPNGNVETPNKEKNVVFQSDKLAEELNNELVNKKDQPQ